MFWPMDAVVQHIFLEVQYCNGNRATFILFMCSIASFILLFALVCKYVGIEYGFLVYVLPFWIFIFRGCGLALAFSYVESRYAFTNQLLSYDVSYIWVNIVLKSHSNK
ncbi:hypothetical protein MtrunA17_Chr4g0075911 [Medicago truncatula]|uniref:Transmembrane protein n=1 Tax=Medicago truncatula TaxID=3880 RepID=A0A396IQ85_MEDTR|nr:hypothetical protein MtrunA17_Chr4g0075911 [Medicago truncatula]